MFVLKTTANSLAASAIVWKGRYDDLLEKWNALVRRINAAGGEAFLQGQQPHPASPATLQLQFSREEIETLIRLCHPDKHSGSQSANAMTQKLLEMRRRS